MKKLFIVANWKSNKTESESREWIQQVSGIKNKVLGIENREIIICPSFASLSVISAEIKNSGLPFKLGAQDISPFEEGAYTGEVNAKQIKEFADYVIIGHSERRQNFNETDEMINKKIETAIKYDLTPIVCISELSQISKLKSQNYNSNVKNLIVAYELPSAIGTGFPDEPDNADAIAKIIKEKHGIQYVLYGASVMSENIRSFTERENINGVLVGNASLDPLEFVKIIENA